MKEKEKEKEGKEGGGSGGRMARKKGERKRWSYVVNPVDCCPKPEREHSQQRHEEFSSIGRGMP